MARDLGRNLGRQGVSLEVREEAVPGRMGWALESMIFRSQPLDLETQQSLVMPERAIMLDSRVKVIQMGEGIKRRRQKRESTLRRVCRGRER